MWMAGDGLDAAAVSVQAQYGSGNGLARAGCCGSGVCEVATQSIGARARAFAASLCCIVASIYIPVHIDIVDRTGELEQLTSPYYASCL